MAAGGDAPLRRTGAAIAGLVLALHVAAAPAPAADLRDAIPRLFGGELCATIQQGVCEPRELRGLREFESLSQLLRSGFPPPPIPSASGSFRFAWDPRFDTYSRQTRSLGPVFAERAETIGKGNAIASFSYSRLDFDTFEDRELGSLVFVEPAFSSGFLERLPAGDRARFADDRLRTELDLEIESDAFTVTAAYGITDEIDLGATLSFSAVRIEGRGVSRVVDCSDPLDPDCAVGDAVLTEPRSGDFCQVDGGKDLACVVDRVDDEAFGTGDIYLRGKWRFARSRLVDLAAAATVTIPTGNADDFLGFADPTFTPLLIASKEIGRLAPHLNLGYSVRSGEDVSQALWVAGVDVRAHERATLAFDLLGFHDDNRDDVNDDVVQSAVGLKLNPIGRTVIAGNLQFPLNRDGLRADLIYTLQIEQTF